MNEYISHCVAYEYGLVPDWYLAKKIWSKKTLIIHIWIKYVVQYRPTDIYDMLIESMNISNQDWRKRTIIISFWPTVKKLAIKTVIN